MSSTSPEHFYELKKAVQETARQRLGIRKAFAEWSLHNIADFQADLQAECKSSISEKWFYNHLKNEAQRLPRIDVLNLLSCYAGFKDWDAFVAEQQQTSKAGRGRAGFILALPALVLLAAVYFLWPAYEKEKVILLSDAYTREHIPLKRVKLWFKNGNYLSANRNGSLKVTGDTLYVDGAYYKPQKVYLGDEDTLRITLFPDDYALMINYFSRSTTHDWQKRREQLMEAIHAEAKIFQSHPRYDGIEMLNRDEFIDRLILPLNSLRNLEIQDIVYHQEKIYRLRFTQKTEENEE